MDVLMPQSTWMCESDQPRISHTDCEIMGQQWIRPFISVRTRQLTQNVDRQKHVLPSTVELPHLKADDKLSFVRCLCQVDPAVIIDRAQQALGGVVGVLAIRGVLEREERKVAARDQAKAVQRCDRGGGFLGPGDMVADAPAEVFETVGTEQEPELEGSKAAAQGYRPLAVIGDPGLAECLQVVRTDAKRANLQFRVREELDRAVELGTEPLVGIEYETVGTLDALP